MRTHVPMNKWESKASLLAHISNSQMPTILIGIDAEAPRDFYSCVISSESNVVEIGIVSSGLGITPRIITLYNEEIAFVGHDTWLTAINVSNLRLIFKKKLNGVFYEFVPINSDDEVIVLHELGAIRIDGVGKEKWAVNTDIVETYALDGSGHMILTVMELGTVTVDIESGKAVIDSKER